MRTPTLWFRLTATVLAGVLLAAPVLPGVAHAQSESGGSLVTEDPPTRVGRVAQMHGTVSFRPAGQSEWEQAALNYPVTGGAFWTEPGAGTELEVGATRLVLDQSTELDIDRLDDHTLVLTLPQGGLYLSLRDVLPGETTTIRTPRGQVTIGQPGRYVIDVGDAAQPTRITALSGAAQVYGEGISLQVNPRQTATITGEGRLQASLGPQFVPPFALAEMAREHSIPTGDYAPPPVLAQMTGGDALVDTGTWEPSPEYGRIWYPPVAVGWVPYRHGHWAWVAPWGWTWIDDAPWGFAPFHYGRWVEIGPRWAWVPVLPGVVVVARPVYAPALVTFIGFGAGVAIGASVGWIPLGPREVYRPPYRASEAYTRRINVTNVHNFTINNTINNTTNNVFINRRAATVVPTSAMIHAQPIDRRVQHVPPASLAGARPLATLPPSPTRAAVGGVRQQAPGARPGPSAPGPAQRPGSQNPAMRPSPGGAPAPRPGIGGTPLPRIQAPQPPRAPQPPNTPFSPRPAPGPSIGQHPPGPQPGTPQPRPMAPGPAAPGFAPQRAQPQRPQAPQPLRPQAPQPQFQRPQPQQPQRPQAPQPQFQRPQVQQPQRPQAPQPQYQRPQAPQPQFQRPQVQQPQFHPQRAAPQPMPQARPMPMPQPRPSAAPQRHCPPGRPGC